MPTFAFTYRPLSGWDGPRTKTTSRRSRWAFKAGWGSTLELLERELQHLAAKELVLEADFRDADLRRDGLPRANARQPVDPGVRIAFESKHGPLIYQSDTCEYWQHNVRSIALGLESLRAVDRYGITSRSQQYEGWRQIEAPRPDVDDTFADWSDAVRTLATFAEVTESDGRQAVALVSEGDLHHLTSLYRLAQRKVHPDVPGGSAALFQRVQAAREDLERRGMWPKAGDQR